MLEPEHTGGQAGVASHCSEGSLKVDITGDKLGVTTGSLHAIKGGRGALCGPAMNCDALDAKCPIETA